MDPHRLPRTALPARYDLRLEPDLDAATFTGEVCITLTVLDAVRELMLNAADLEVQQARLWTEGGRHLSATVNLDGVAEWCRLVFDELLLPGRARLTLRFTGTLNDRLRGFYRSKCKDASGEWRWLAATQFEATDARRCFPCWDEPGFKAVFSSTLVVPAGLAAVSNSAIASERSEGGKRVVRFADTIPMSTYLVAFLVGPLGASEPVYVGTTPLRVWSIPGKGHLTRFAREVAAFSLGYFEEYYGCKYPGDKLDLVAIPDFAAGAMENLGAITFRETALLVDEAAATHAEKERVADVVSHENAHMWFGDLVTMAWWNGLWLNEAFATFMEMKAVDAWKPAWQRWTTFGVSRAQALAVDGLHSTRPVEFPVAAPAEAEAMFDVLTYEKGASVLRMLEQYAGEDKFRDGVRRYLTKHAYANAETGDLWAALADEEVDVPAMMDGWVFRPGYPLVEVRRQGRSVVLRQRRFAYLPLDAETEKATWQVPIRMRTFLPAGSEVVQGLLEREELWFAQVPADVQAVLVNDGGHGFYRVRYEPDLLKALVDRLGELKAIDRFNLVNDAWALVLAGRMGLTEYVELTRSFEGERDRNVWSVVLGSLAVLDRVIEPSARGGLQALVRRRLASAVAELGWEARPGEDELTSQLRGDLLRAAGVLGDAPEVQGEAERVLARGGDAAVQAAAVAVMAHTGDAARYEEFFGRYRAAQTPQEEQRYLLALAGFRPAELVERTLSLTLGEVRTQDAPLLVRALLLGVHSRARAWEFVRANWPSMATKYASPGLRRLCEGVLGLTMAQWEAEARAFFADKELPFGPRPVEQVLEQLRVVVRMREREADALRGLGAGA
jgi:puromycin-sensitive aminopeptidase